jgi:hypothetical protein
MQRIPFCRHKRALLLLAALFAGAIAPVVGRTQTDAYPNRPVRLVVPFPPGGSVDLNARLLSGNFPSCSGNRSSWITAAAPRA